MKQGFSLIELLLVISLISLLGAYSVYGIQHLLQKRELDNAIAELSSSLYFTQSVGQTSGFMTIICASSDSKTCNKIANWSSGWIVYHDTNQNHKLDTAEPIVQVQRLSPGVRVSFNSPGDGGKVIFYQTGRLWPNGSFMICHQRLKLGRKIFVIQSGRIRSAAITKTDCQ